MEASDQDLRYEETVEMIKSCDIGNEDTDEIYRRMATFTPSEILVDNETYMKPTEEPTSSSVCFIAMPTDCADTEHEIPEYGRDDHSGTLDFASSCSPKYIWDTIRAACSSNEIIITHDDMWTIEGSISMDGDLLEIKAALYHGPDSAFTVGFDLIKGDLNQFVFLLDKLRSDCKHIDNLDDFPFGKAGVDEFWSRDPKYELYPGSTEMDEEELKEIFVEMTSQSHPYTKRQAAKTLALAMISPLNCMMLLRQEGSIDALLALSRGDDADIQRFALYILIQLTEHENCQCRKQIQDAALNGVISDVNPLHVTTQKLVKQWLKQFHLVQSN